MKAPRSLQARLTLLVLALVGAVWLATAALLAVDAGHELDELLDGHLAQAAALLVAQQARDLDGDGDELAVDAPVLHRYAPRVAFQVFHEGQLVMRSAGAPDQPLLGPGLASEMSVRNQAQSQVQPPSPPSSPSPHVGDARQTAPEPNRHLRHEGFHTVDRDGARWRVFATRGAERDVQVYVAEQLEARHAIVRAVLRSGLAPAALAVPLLALGVWWAVRRGTAPLRTLQAQLASRHSRQPQALHPVDVPGAPAEMQPMVDALNALFARIAALMEAERRFTADAAHELRTPIAAIRTQAQVALGATADAERRRALAATLEGCDRATRLVAQLLTLSRLEADQAPALQPVDLAAVARQVLADLAPQAIARDQTLELDAPQTSPVRGDATLLAVLLRNLVDNALRYSPAQATVQVTVALDAAIDGGTVRFSVDDSGPGLDDADLARLGERFFRVLGSGQDGSGLGWSIVRRIAAVHGAAVQVERSAALGGLSVRVVWPGEGPARG